MPACCAWSKLLPVAENIIETAEIHLDSNPIAGLPGGVTIWAIWKTIRVIP